jgi:hypothetical protein
VVRQRSAKPLFSGSNPDAASTSLSHFSSFFSPILNPRYCNCAFSLYINKKVLAEAQSTQRNKGLFFYKKAFLCALGALARNKKGSRRGAKHAKK